MALTVFSYYGYSKRKMLTQQCNLTEQLDATNQSNLMHAQIRTTIGAHKGTAEKTKMAILSWFKTR